MSNTSNKKRARPQPSSVPAKRARTDGGSKPKKIAPVDALKWKEVSLPDRLDDIEGFYGLEEVEGVDIVRENGKIEFAVVNPKAWDPEAAVHYDDWAGFGDGDAQEDSTTETASKGPTPATGKDSSEPKKKKKKPNKKTKKEAVEKKADEESEEDTNPFAALGESMGDDIDLPGWNDVPLSLSTLRALAAQDFKTPTAVQSAAIPQILKGRDLIGKAATGSGKTLAFGIPMLEHFLKVHIPGTRNTPLVGLVLAPTRELAKQITKHLEDLASAGLTGMKVASVTGGLSLQKQQRVLEYAHVVVATPGRLWEIMSEGRGWVDKLKHAQFLVIDEADRVLQEGHYDEVEKILKVMNEDFEDESEDEEELGTYGSVPSVKKNKRMTPLHRQTLVFSATFHKGLMQKLAGKTKSQGGELMSEKESMEWLLKRLNFREEKPCWIDIENDKKGIMAENLKEALVECGAMEKDLYLYYMLLRYPARTLVFTNSISSVKRLVPFLNLLLPGRASPLHSSMPQKSRLRYLDRFSSPNNKDSILVATDVAARGLDIKNIEMVVHYHVPRTADMYVHRSGRTARAGDAGISVMLCSAEEVNGVRKLIQKVHQFHKIKGGAIKSFEVDRTIVGKLKSRIQLAKKISDAERDTQKSGKEDNWLRKAAEDFGVDFDSDDFGDSGRRGDRSKGKSKKGREAHTLTKAEVASLKAQLRDELSQSINTGFSAKYLTSGGAELAQMLIRGQGGAFLGLEQTRAVDEVN